MQSHLHQQLQLQARATSVRLWQQRNPTARRQAFPACFLPKDASKNDALSPEGIQLLLKKVLPISKPCCCKVCLPCKIPALRYSERTVKVLSMSQTTAAVADTGATVSSTPGLPSVPSMIGNIPVASSKKFKRAGLRQSDASRNPIVAEK